MQQLLGVLLTPDGTYEACRGESDVLNLIEELQAPLLKVALPSATTVHWSQKHYAYDQVNDAGSKLCGMLIKGDCVVTRSKEAAEGDDALGHLLAVLRLRDHTGKMMGQDEEQQPYVLTPLPQQVLEEPLHSNATVQHEPEHLKGQQQQEEEEEEEEEEQQQQQDTLEQQEQPHAEQQLTLLDMPPEIISLILQALPPKLSASMPMMQTCRLFRRVALDCPHFLMRLWFNLPDIHHPLSSHRGPARSPSTSTHSTSERGSAAPSTHNRTRGVRRLLPLQSEARQGDSGGQSSNQRLLDAACASLLADREVNGNLSTTPATLARGSKRVTGGPQWAIHSGTVKPQASWAGMTAVPAPLARAAHHGNPSACGVMAQLLEVNGYVDDCEVLLFWRRCAKYADIEAMLKLGFALYEGTCGCAVDVDAAHAWLSKALRALLGGVPSLSQISVDLGSSTITVSASATPVVAAAAAVPSASAPSSSTAWGPADTQQGGCTQPGWSTQRGWLPFQLPQLHEPVATAGGVVVPGKPHTCSLLELVKMGCSADQKAAATAATEAASLALSASAAQGPQSRRHKTGEEEGCEVPPEGLPGPSAQERVRARAFEQRQKQQRMQREELEMAMRKLKRMEGHVLVPRPAWDDPALLPFLARAAELLGYIYFDGEAGIKADQVQACTLFKLATLAGSREAARVLGWIFSTGQYGYGA